MVNSHPAHHAIPMQECGSIRIFGIFSPGASVPKIPSAAFSSKEAPYSARLYPQSLTHPNQSAPKQLHPEQAYGSRIHGTRRQLPPHPPYWLLAVPPDFRTASWQACAAVNNSSNLWSLCRPFSSGSESRLE